MLLTLLYLAPPPIDEFKVTRQILIYRYLQVALIILVLSAATHFAMRHHERVAAERHTRHLSSLEEDS